MQDTTTAPPRAVALEDLSFSEQARYLRRTDPTRAVAFDLQHGGRPLARMFYDASGRPARGPEALDPQTRAALYEWAQLLDLYARRPAVGR